MRYHLLFNIMLFLILLWGSGCAISHQSATIPKAETTVKNEKRLKKIDLLSSQISKLYHIPISEANSTAPYKDITLTKSDIFVKVMLDGNFVFKKGSKYLRKKAKDLIGKLVSLIRYDKTLTIQVVGHADSSGDKRKNQALSDARAISVAEIFYDKGIKENLYAKGCGSKKPIYHDKDANLTAGNRRVEIFIYPEKSLLKNPCK